VKAEQHGSIFVGAPTRGLKELKSKVALYTHVHLKDMKVAELLPILSFAKEKGNHDSYCEGLFSSCHVPRQKKAQG
jgi:hypothetical protein